MSTKPVATDHNKPVDNNRKVVILRGCEAEKPPAMRAGDLMPTPDAGVVHYRDPRITAAPYPLCQTAKGLNRAALSWYTTAFPNKITCQTCIAMMKRAGRKRSR